MPFGNVDPRILSLSNLKTLGRVGKPGIYLKNYVIIIPEIQFRLPKTAASQYSYY